MEDFIVDTEGRCFLCMDKTSFNINTVSHDKSPSGLTHSLQYLSLYLKMNKRKVFDEEGHVPPDLLAKVERSRLTSNLCDECALLNDQFSKLYRQLEMTELTITSCLNLINVKLMKSEPEVNETQGVFKHDQPESNQNGKQSIVHALRTEAVQKCSQKLSVVRPNIKVRRLGMKDVVKKKLKLKLDSLRGKPLLKQSLDITGKQETLDWSVINESVSEPNTKINEANRREVNCSNSTVNDDYEDSNTDLNAFNDADDEEVKSGIIRKPLEDYGSRGKKDEDDTITIPTAFSSELSKDKISVKGRFTKSVTGKYVCKDCSREFSSPAAIHLHYRATHLKIRYKCNLCEKMFTRKHDYDRHLQAVHMGVRFKCTSCNKLFTTKRNLKRHSCRVYESGQHI